MNSQEVLSVASHFLILSRAFVCSTRFTGRRHILFIKVSSGIHHAHHFPSRYFRTNSIVICMSAELIHQSHCLVTLRFCGYLVFECDLKCVKLCKRKMTVTFLFVSAYNF